MTLHRGAGDRWRDTEPVRLYLYGLLVPAAGLAVLYGLLSAEQAAGWLVVAGAALGVGVPAVELARSRVQPLARLQQDQQRRDE